MSQLYDLSKKIDGIIAERGLPEAKIKGAIGLKSGVLLAFVRPDTPDDPSKIQNLKTAIKEILDVAV